MAVPIEAVARLLGARAPNWILEHDDPNISAPGDESGDAAGGDGEKYRLEEHGNAMIMHTFRSRIGERIRQGTGTDGGLLEYHRALLYIWDGKPFSHWIPVPEASTTDMTASVRSAFVYVVVALALILDGLQSLFKVWLENDASWRILSATSSNLASASDLTIAHLPRIMTPFAVLIFALIRMAQGKRLTVSECVVCICSSILGTVATQALLRTPWFGVVCRCFGGNMPTLSTQLASMMMALAVYGYFGTISSLIITVSISALLSSSGLFGFFLVEVLSGPAFF